MFAAPFIDTHAPNVIFQVYSELAGWLLVVGLIANFQRFWLLSVAGPFTGHGIAPHRSRPPPPRRKKHWALIENPGKTLDLGSGGVLAQRLRRVILLDLGL